MAVISKVAWAFFLISLPVTSFPIFPGGLGGSTLVRPLSVYPLIILLVLVILPRFILKPIPKTFLAFLPFVLVALASTLLATMRSIEGIQGISVGERMVRALATLGIGGAIYLAVTLWPTNEDELRFSLRWMYIGFAISLLWGSLQAIYILHYSPGYFDLLSDIQRFISTRRLFANRISGMSYEPNWFADQISFLLLPWLLASVLSGVSVFRLRWRWLTVEWGLLGWSLALIPFTYSRAGLVIMLILVLTSVVFLRGKKSSEQPTKHMFGRLPILRMVEVTILVAILGGLVYFSGSKNSFFARAWEYFQRKPDQGYLAYIGDYFEYLGFGARFAYWGTAYRIFETHPILGVGLGNYAFYFDENLPDIPLATMPEVLRLVVPEEGRTRLITAKNLYLRVLAETGLVGAATFSAFLIAILGCALYLWFSTGRESRFWGIGGVLGMFAFIMVAFSFDSFAVPNMWVMFGIITAAMHRLR
jgi:hypothetical protein